MHAREHDSVRRQFATASTTCSDHSARRATTYSAKVGPWLTPTSGGGDTTTQLADRAAAATKQQLCVCVCAPRPEHASQSTPRCVWAGPVRWAGGSRTALAARAPLACQPVTLPRTHLFVYNKHQPHSKICMPFNCWNNGVICRILLFKFNGTCCAVRQHTCIYVKTSCIVLKLKTKATCNIHIHTLTVHSGWSNSTCLSTVRKVAEARDKCRVDITVCRTSYQFKFVSVQIGQWN